MDASIILEAIVSSPTVWFVLIPTVRSISVLVQQIVFTFGFFKSLDKNNTNVLSDPSTTLKLPTELEALEMKEVHYSFKLELYGLL
jgi:hypothetical protein